MLITILSILPSLPNFSPFPQAQAICADPPCLSLRTTLTLNSIASVPWGHPVTVTGKLTFASGEAIEGETITFSPSGPPCYLNLPSAATQSDGSFSVPSSKYGWLCVTDSYQIHAGFAGDSEERLQSSGSVQTLNTLPHRTNVTLDPVSDVPWGNSATATGRLFDIDDNTMISTTEPSFVALPQITFSSPIPLPTGDSLPEATDSDTDQYIIK